MTTQLQYTAIRCNYNCNYNAYLFKVVVRLLRVMRCVFIGLSLSHSHSVNPTVVVDQNSVTDASVMANIVLIGEPFLTTFMAQRKHVLHCFVPPSDMPSTVKSVHGDWRLLRSSNNELFHKHLNALLPARMKIQLADERHGQFIALWNLHRLQLYDGKWQWLPYSVRDVPRLMAIALVQRLLQGGSDGCLALPRVSAIQQVNGLAASNLAINETAQAQLSLPSVLDVPPSPAAVQFFGVLATDALHHDPLPPDIVYSITNGFADVAGATASSSSQSIQDELRTISGVPRLPISSSLKTVAKRTKRKKAPAHDTQSSAALGRSLVYMCVWI
jgi:hypothetical protein